MNIVEELKKLSDSKYAQFQVKLAPTIDKTSVLGVRVPLLRKFYKEAKNSVNWDEFLNELPHKYYDENMLHSMVVSDIKDYDKCIYELDKYLPYVDNWAACDTITPKVFKKNKDRLIIKINEWVDSKHIYTCRFGIQMIMNFFLDDDFKEEYLDIPLRVRSDEYYVKMMQAWFYATALAKQWDSAIKIIENKKLDTWVHNKTIQKAKESYRITEEQKVYLDKYKIK